MPITAPRDSQGQQLPYQTASVPASADTMAQLVIDLDVNWLSCRWSGRPSQLILNTFPLCSVHSRHARGINRGLNYTTQWRLQTHMTRRKPWRCTRDATVDDGARPPEAGAQVRILPGAPFSHQA